MNTSKLILSIVGLALMATPAVAKPVFGKLDGKYATSYNLTCQAVQNGSDPGLTAPSAYITNFHSDIGKASFAIARVSGGLAIWRGGTQGMTHQNIPGTIVYSNAATTATFDGVVYDAVYGPVKNGIAESALLSGIAYNVGEGCAASIVLIRLD